MNKPLSLVLIAAMFILCSRKKEVKLEPTTRSIKYMKVQKQATGQIRRFSGVVYAVDFSEISFEDVGGKVNTVKVDIGDEVTKGQILATLDKEKFELDLKSAQANLKKAEANLVKTKTEYDRELQLFKKKASYQQQVDTKKFQYEAAQSSIKSAKAKVGLAERNLRNTELKAPYNGFVGKREIEPNQVVSIGQMIFRIDAKGGMEVHFDIPENLKKRVKLDMSGNVSFPSHPNEIVKCAMSFIGSAAGKGNAFPAKVVLNNPPMDIKPGMTAEVSLSLPLLNSEQIGYLIPPKAVLPGKEPKTGFVFKYDPKTKKVKKSLIRAKGAQGNFGIVHEGVKEGDIIATAGVSFLADGMEVNLYESGKTKGE